MLNYYEVAAQASNQIGNNIGLKRISNLAINATSILDIGCGEGSRLNLFSPKRGSVGIDVNIEAITSARKKYPSLKFLCQSADKLPFKSNTFDLVYSAFVLEHTINPQFVVSEALRVTKVGGHTCFLFPNFGAPNRRSPNSVESPIFKLLKGILDDLSHSKGSNISWKFVTPKSFYENIDDDTSVEPYLLSLKCWIPKNYSVSYISSLWDIEPFSLNPRKLLFKILGVMRIYPFVYWGPQGYIELHKLS